MSNPTRVGGTLTVEGEPAERTVRVFSWGAEEHLIDGQNLDFARSLGHAQSDPVTGDWSVDLLGGFQGEVMAVALPNSGVPFQPDLAVEIGDRIRPTEPNGLVYQVTVAGTLPSTEPVWPTAVDATAPVGTAEVITRELFRPVVDGPIKPKEIIDWHAQTLSFHGGLAAGIQSDGTLIAWGDTGSGRGSPPAGTYVDVSSAEIYAVAVRDDGVVVGWGSDWGGVITNIPDLSNAVRVRAGKEQGGLILTDDGVIHRWGNTQTGSPPSGPASDIDVAENGTVAGAIINGEIVVWGPGAGPGGVDSPPAGTDFERIWVSSDSAMAQKSDGTLVAWGIDSEATTNLPADPVIDAELHGGGGLAVLESGDVVVWGSGSSSIPQPPSPITGAVLVAAGLAEEYGGAIFPDGSLQIWGTGPSGVTTVPANLILSTG